MFYVFYDFFQCGGKKAKTEVIRNGGINTFPQNCVSVCNNVIGQRFF